jgi:hypothetical protein
MFSDLYGYGLTWVVVDLGWSGRPHSLGSVTWSQLISLSVGRPGLFSLTHGQLLTLS